VLYSVQSSYNSCSLAGLENCLNFHTYCSAPCYRFILLSLFTYDSGRDQSYSGRAIINECLHHAMDIWKVTFQSALHIYISIKLTDHIMFSQPVLPSSSGFTSPLCQVSPKKFCEIFLFYRTSSLIVLHSSYPGWIILKPGICIGETLLIPCLYLHIDVLQIFRLILCLSVWGWTGYTISLQKYRISCIVWGFQVLTISPLATSIEVFLAHP